MKKIRLLPFFFLFFTLFMAMAAFSQPGCSPLQVSHSNSINAVHNLSYWFSVLELPFLFITVFFAFATANEMKGGKFGRGMTMIAWGFLIMALGHLHMQVEHFYNYNVFKMLLGETGGAVLWFLALVITWGFSGMGFYSIYKASKG